MQKLQAAGCLSEQEVTSSHYRSSGSGEVATLARVLRDLFVVPKVPPAAIAPVDYYWEPLMPSPQSRNAWTKERLLCLPPAPFREGSQKPQDSTDSA